MEKNFFKQRAQSAVESILITAMALFILTAFTAIIFDQIYLFNENQNRVMASTAINSLVREVNDVFFLGPGSIKTVRVVLPEGFDSKESFIKDKSFSLRVGESVVSANTGVEVRGEWPIDGGNHFFVLTAFNDFVLVSETRLIISPTQISAHLRVGEESEFELVLFNDSDSIKIYSVFFDSSDGIDLTNLEGGEVSVLARDSNLASVGVSCKSNAFGSHSSRIVFVSSSSSDANISVPVSVFCFD